MDGDDVGLTIRDLVLEVRADVRDLKEDLHPRVVALESDSIKTKAVASALLSQKKETFTKRQKIGGAVFALITLVFDIFLLSGGPH